MDATSYVLVQDTNGTTHKCPGVYGAHDVTTLCGVDLSGREAIPRVVGPGRYRDLAHCNTCSDAQDARTVAVIVAAGGRGDTCSHGYGPLDSCPCCD
jgi:hypothetical protein